MSAQTPPPEPAPSAPSTATKVGFAATLVVLAVILVVSARTAPAVEEDRIGRRVELMELIQMEQARVASLAAKVDELSAEVNALERENVGDADLFGALEEQIMAVSAAAGMTGVTGPGVVATLTDSSLSASPTGDLNDLVIHEQDLQAVINALWAGGAEAMSVNGQRVLATTAIRCVGNTLLLHGQVYSPPYVIEAVGDGVALRSSLERDPAVDRFRAAVKDFSLGFEVEDAAELLIPAYEGTTSLQVAQPDGAEG